MRREALLHVRIVISNLRLLSFRGGSYERDELPHDC